MNQSILFPDIQTWDAVKNVIVFPAQQSGALIECVVSKSYLENMVGSAIETEQQAIQVFQKLRFDLEEQAEELIEEEEFNLQGQIELG
ncbi:DUF1488 domain-containing protein [Vibrio sp. SCSIO 43135]|uniref:DUF1488 domain-containing protein n=1 Tax=Vibrio sp. SCSIO 43135 TaxID=2819096 RepID=UPI00207648A3|nr:DUF1488 domain-containing protein [Vibrio sp. SCSIO 43135]USD41200.1 DUF1488 domain-containing protein [Vibrio sp. SCSIO 43135]